MLRAYLRQQGSLTSSSMMRSTNAAEHDRNGTILLSLLLSATTKPSSSAALPMASCYPGRRAGTNRSQGKVNPSLSSWDWYMNLFFGLRTNKYTNDRIRCAVKSCGQPIRTAIVVALETKLPKKTKQKKHPSQNYYSQQYRQCRQRLQPKCRSSVAEPRETHGRIRHSELAVSTA